jgi:hypothetical protein
MDLPPAIAQKDGNLRIPYAERDTHTDGALVETLTATH